PATYTLSLHDALPIFAFIGSWNSLLWPLLVVQTDEWRPIAFGLAKFVQNDASDEFNLHMTASVIMILPILLLYFIAQKQFTEGIDRKSTRLNSSHVKI